MTWLLWIAVILLAAFPLWIFCTCLWHWWRDDILPPGTFGEPPTNRIAIGPNRRDQP